jgi:hypothetical protein
MRAQSSRESSGCRRGRAPRTRASARRGGGPKLGLLSWQATRCGHGLLASPMQQYAKRCGGLRSQGQHANATNEPRVLGREGPSRHSPGTGTLARGRKPRGGLLPPAAPTASADLAKEREGPLQAAMGLQGSLPV